MKFEKCMAAVLASFLVMATVSAKAQYMIGGGVGANFGGTGMIMGQQACPYGAQAGDGASSYLDEYNEIKRAKSEEERKLSEMKRKLRRLEKDLDRARDVITSVVDDRYSDSVISHMDNARDCSEYNYDNAPPTKSQGRYEEDGDELPPAETAQARMTPISGFSPAQWSRVCVPGRKGGINGIVCNVPFAGSERGRYTPNECKRSLETYRKGAVEMQRLQGDIEQSENRIDRYKDELPEALRDAKDRMREDRQAGTEGDICVECMANGNGYITQRTSPDWAGVAANVGVGLLATYMGYKTNKMVAQYNSDLGWPTQAYPAWGYGLPFLANGLYGALGGGMGVGGFGCAGGVGGAGFPYGAMGGMGPFGMGGGMYGNVGMNGPFGYPYGMMGSPYGGGMYGGGMGPWGPNMGGGIGMGYPGMGMGYPGMGMGIPGMGYPMGGGFAISGGFAMSGGMGYPGMGYPGMGAGIPGMGYPMGGGFAMSGGIGYPGMGYPMGGGFAMSGGIGYPGMGYPGMGAGIPGMGYPMGGGFAMSGGMGYPGMGTMGMGYPGMGTMDGGLGSMQMQQALMQMQMQQYQLVMQQQQQQMQNAMARQQALSGLQVELQNLMYRIQQVQMGGPVGTGYIGGSIGGGVSIGGGIGIGGGISTIPSTGSPFPANTTPGSVVIPAGQR